MQTRLRLVDGADELVLWSLDSGRRDVIIDELEVGSPAAREVVEDRADDDGTDDDTQYHGAAAVSLKLTVNDTPEGLLAQIRPWMRFGRRPWLCLSDDEWADEHRIRLRADQWSAPIPYAGLGERRTVQLQWKAPDGVWFGTNPVSLALLATGGAGGGRSYTSAGKFPRRYGTTSGVGQSNVTNPGDRPAHQLVRMYGPCRGPRYTCDDTGQTVSFTEGLYLPLGQYVEVDTKAGTATLQSDPLASVLQYVDFAVSSWWRLPSGTSRVRYHPISEVDVGCSMTSSFYPTFS